MAVDFCPRDIASQVPTAAPGASEFSCAACGEAFESAILQRAHCKSERHVYNTKRRLAGLRPITQEAWERKLRESRGSTATGPKGTSHLKASKVQRKVGGEAIGALAPVDATAREEAAALVEGGPEHVREDDLAFTPRRCLFDRQRFETQEECLRYMWRNYGFSIPDAEYCTNVRGLLDSLWHKILEPPHSCLFCNKRFPDAASCRRHMIDKSHARVGTEARSRRGLINDESTGELQSSLEEFYDFTASTREITERITDPAQKVAALLRFFDKDRDGYLDRPELAALWAATSSEGGELLEGQYNAACLMAGVLPQQGIDTEALQRLYGSGLASLDAHFGVLQDLLAEKLSGKKSVAGEQRNAKSADEGSDGANSEGDNQDSFLATRRCEETSDEDNEDEEGEEDGSEESSEGDGSTEIIECEDEDEFEEVMRVLGLQPATILPNGDLRLPNGSTAAHRDIAYIWKQRGQRNGALALPSGRPMGSKSTRAQLMLSNSAEGSVAVTRREQAREGKKVIAVLRQRQHAEMKLGLKQNLLQKKKPQKFRTIVGDCSGGR